MAIVKYGSVVDELKGKLGGSVFQKCGNALSVRSNLSHNPPSSESAMLSRTQFAQIAYRWRNMSEAQKLLWNQNASSFPSVDGFGNPQILTGYQTFILCNRSLLLIGRPLSVASTPYNPPTFSDLDIGSMFIGGATLTFNALSAIPATTTILVYTTKGFKGEIPLNSVKKTYATFVNSASMNPLNIFTPVYGVINPKPVAGENILTYSVAVNNVTGHPGMVTGIQVAVS